MPPWKDYRLEQVAKRAGVCERTARRWRDSNDERWHQHLMSIDPIEGIIQENTHLNLQPLTPIEYGWDKIFASNPEGKWVEPASFDKEDAMDALTSFVYLLNRFGDVLAMFRYSFEGRTDEDSLVICDCSMMLKKILLKYQERQPLRVEASVGDSLNEEAR